MRVSSQQMTDRILTHLARTQQRLATAQDRVSSGKRIQVPSDDPVDTQRLLAAKTDIELGQQYARNINVALGELSATESSLGEFTNLLSRASELAVQAANGTLNSSERVSIAQELSQLIARAIDVGNTQYAGHYIFSGQLTNTAPYVPDDPTTPTVVVYAGDTGRIDREVSAGSRISVNITGDRMDPFATLITFRDNLLADDTGALGLDAGLLNDQLDVMLRLRSEIGAVVRRADTSLVRLADDEVRLRIDLAMIEELDLAQTIVELQMSETAYEAALGVAARSMSLSILDFLR